MGTGVQKAIKDKEETYTKGSTSEKGGREVLQGRGEGLQDCENDMHVCTHRHTHKSKSKA